MSSQLHNTWHESSCGVFQRGSPLWLHELALFPSQFNHLRIHKILFPFYLAIYRCTSQMGHIDAKRGNRNLSLFLLNWIIYLFYHFNICLLAQSRTHIRVRFAHNRCDRSRLCLVEMQRGEEQRRNYYKEKWVYDHAGGLYPIAIYNIINVCFIRFLLYFVSQKWRQTTTTKKCNKYVVALPHSRKNGTTNGMCVYEFHVANEQHNADQKSRQRFYCAVRVLLDRIDGSHIWNCTAKKSRPNNKMLQYNL